MWRGAIWILIPAFKIWGWQNLTWFVEQGRMGCEAKQVWEEGLEELKLKLGAF